VKQGLRQTYIDPKNLPPIERGTLLRILRYLRAYWGRALVVVACIVLAAGLNLAPPWFVKHIVDGAIPHGDLKLLFLYCAGMVVGPLLAGLVQVAQKYGAEKIGQQVMLDLRVEIYRHLHRMPFSYFARAKPGEAVSHVLNDVQGVGNVMSGTLVDLVQNSVVLLSTIGFCVVLDWRLAIVAVGLLPLFIAPTRRVGRKRKGLRRGVQQRMGELTGILAETLSISGALLVKVFGSEEAELRRFAAKAEEIKTLSLQQWLVGRWFQMLLNLFEAVGPALVFAFGGWLVVSGSLKLGTIVAFVTLLKRLYNPASQLAGVHVDLVTSYAYFDRIFEVLDLVPSIVDAPGARALGRVSGEVVFEHVGFAYADRGETLFDIDLVIPEGKTVAVVGPSGAGKSTIASLVPRLYDPTSGVVRVDGVDVREVTLESLRANIAVVTQETFLFHASLLDNLRYGRPSATQAEVEEAARRAQIHDLIARLPEGYATTVGERGYRFSGGERQRLAIARAILKDPRILILDEATSSLDSASERLVQDALAPLLRGRTSLVIAHRLSTIRDADRIVVLEAGRIAEQGVHDELVARAGLYAKLWAEQLRDAGRDTGFPPANLRRVRAP
jgi:ATP-binding cassette, subfamily B, bacterial